jgi:hypothetical protein
MKFGWMGPGDYFVAEGETYLGRVVKTSRRWEAWRGSEGINVGQEFKSRQEAGAHLAALNDGSATCHPS